MIDLALQDISDLLYLDATEDDWYCPEDQERTRYYLNEDGYRCRECDWLAREPEAWDPEGVI